MFQTDTRTALTGFWTVSAELSEQLLLDVCSSWPLFLVFRQIWGRLSNRSNRGWSGWFTKCCWRTLENSLQFYGSWILFWGFWLLGELISVLLMTFCINLTSWNWDSPVTGFGPLRFRIRFWSITGNLRQFFCGNWDIVLDYNHWSL